MPVRLKAAPRVGARVPGWCLRAAVAALGTALCLSQLSFGFWFWVGIVLVGVATAFPATPAAWMLMVLLGSGVLVQPASGIDWRIYALIAGIHLLHVLASYSRALPARLWIQLRTLFPPLRRFLLIQIPVQLVAIGALFVFGRGSGGLTVTVPILGIVAAIALAALALLLLAPVVRDKVRQPR